MSNQQSRIGSNQHPPAAASPLSAQIQQSSYIQHPYQQYPQPQPRQQQQHQQSAPLQQSYQTQAQYSSPLPNQSQKHEMVSLPPPPHIQQEVMYRQGGNQYDHYAQGQQHPPPMGYAPQQTQPPPQQQQQQQQQQAPVPYNQPAPRQRTAIACRYCRRRKIRCYGFDTNPDGRCQNCSRFNQECVFTPVSSQTHAFVPAHTAYPQLRNQQARFPGSDGRQIYAPPGGGPPIYGAHGQPLGPVAGQQHQHQHQQQHHHQPPQNQHQPAPEHPPYPPPPNGPGQPYAVPNPYPTLPQQQQQQQQPPPSQQQPQPAPYEQRGPLPHHPPPHDDPVSGVKRQRIGDGGVYATIRHGGLPSPVSPKAVKIPFSHNDQRRNSAGAGYDYNAHPTTPASHIPPISPSAQSSYQDQQYSGSYYPPQDLSAQVQRRQSPPAANYNYDAGRASASPHSSVSGPPPGPLNYHSSYPGGLHPPQVLPPADGRNASPSATQARDGTRPGTMSVAGMLDNSQSQSGRSNADNSMISRLNNRV